MTGRVKSVNHHNNTITAELNGEKINVELSKPGNVLRLYKEEEREFAKGDKVVFLQNDSVLGVQNGLTGAIEKINAKGDARVALGPGQKIELNITDYPYLDYGYAVTEYKAQGQTVSNVIYIADTRNINNYQNFYVAIIRAKEDIHIYTNNVIDLLDQVKQELVKTSTLDYQPNLTNELEFQMQA